MSATNRNGRKRAEADFYETPHDIISSFIDAWEDAPNFAGLRILDPCSGGRQAMSGQILKMPPYAHVLRRYGATNVSTIDIRQESAAQVKQDYLQMPKTPEFDLVISNPPFSLAREFVEHSLENTVKGGYVVFLLRLNILGSQRRHEWWQDRIPFAIYVHSKRPRFFGGGSDATEYAHFVWKKGYINPLYTVLRVIP